MIAHVRGIVVEADGDRVVVDVGGVGLELLAPARLVAQAAAHVGEERSYVTHLHVREDALQLFGFANRRELVFFRQLTAVSGVGPKVALSILSAYPVEDLELAALQDDHKRFESIPGIGHKLAQRLIVELRDRIAVPEVGTAAVSSEDGTIADLVAARSALMNLGLTYAEADAALKGAPAEAPVEELVRYALVKARGS
jgi:holliday junction DNA helicase RuvA